MEPHPERETLRQKPSNWPDGAPSRVSDKPQISELHRRINNFARLMVRDFFSQHDLRAFSEFYANVGR